MPIQFLEAKITGQMSLKLGSNAHSLRVLVVSSHSSLYFAYSSSMAIGVLLVVIILLFQSTLDTILALGAFVSCSTMCFLVSYLIHHGAEIESPSLNWSPPKQWSPRGNKLNNAEFHRIRVVSSESSEEAYCSDSDSTNEVTKKSSNWLSLLSFFF